MNSFVKKIKKMYKGSYYYANKKYGKYTKRRPFPNFNDFDCSPSGDFSMNEVPSEMNTNKIYSQKTNYDNYIVTSDDKNSTVVGNTGSNYTSNTSTPVNSCIFNDINSNNISPVTTISDNTDFTMVNSNNINNPFDNEMKQNRNSLSEAINPFYDNSESIDNESSFTTNFDGMNYTSNVNNDSYANKMNPVSYIKDSVNTSEDNIKIDYKGQNNWEVEMKRYYPSVQKTDESDIYNTSTTYSYNEQYNTNQDYNMGMGMEMKKKKWWKKILPKNKSHSSSFSDNTYCNDDDEYGPKRYDSKRHSSYYSSYKNDYNNYSRYNSSLTDGVLVVNQNAKATNV
eukprot:jgi/Orpsp1_1/1190382/evm.model.d7180000078601.1